MRELLERGFEVAVVSDGTAAAIVAEGDGYAAALVNFRFMASHVMTTEETVGAVAEAARSSLAGYSRPAGYTRRR